VRWKFCISTSYLRSTQNSKETFTNAILRLPGREVLSGIGPVRVQVPKVRDRSGEGAVFHSKLVPPYVRRSRSVEAAVP
jgi:hypothetical protein